MKFIEKSRILLFLAGVVCLLAMWTFGCNATDEQPVETSQQIANMPPYDDGGLYERMDKDGNYELGSALLVDDFRVVFLDYSLFRNGYDSFFRPSEGYRVMRAYFRLENRGDASIEHGSLDFSCTSGDIECKRLYVNARDSMPTRISVDVGEKIEGWVYFEVPETFSNLKITYNCDVSPVFVLNQH